MKRILLSGYYGFGNVGDEAILTSTIKTLQLQAPGVQIAVLSNEPAETARTYNVRAMHRMWPHHVLNAISETDLVVFGGGSLLQDDTSLRSLLYYLSVIFLAKIMGKPVIVYANGIGPLHSRLGRFLTRVALNTVKDITVRDQESFKELKKIGVNKTLPLRPIPLFAGTRW